MNNVADYLDPLITQEHTSVNNTSKSRSPRRRHQEADFVHIQSQVHNRSSHYENELQRIKASIDATAQIGATAQVKVNAGAKNACEPECVQVCPPKVVIVEPGPEFTLIPPRPWVPYKTVEYQPGWEPRVKYEPVIKKIKKKIHVPTIKWVGIPLPEDVVESFQMSKQDVEHRVEVGTEKKRTTTEYQDVTRHVQKITTEKIVCNDMVPTIMKDNEDIETHYQDIEIEVERIVIKEIEVPFYVKPHRTFGKEFDYQEVIKSEHVTVTDTKTKMEKKDTAASFKTFVFPKDHLKKDEKFHSWPTNFKYQQYRKQWPAIDFTPIDDNIDRQFNFPCTAQEELRYSRNKFWGKTACHDGTIFGPEKSRTAENQRDDYIRKNYNEQNWVTEEKHELYRVNDRDYWQGDQSNVILPDKLPLKANFNDQNQVSRRNK